MNVLRAIDKLPRDEFWRLNFEPTDYVTEQGKISLRTAAEPDLAPRTNSCCRKSRWARLTSQITSIHGALVLLDAGYPALSTAMKIRDPKLRTLVNVLDRSCLKRPCYRPRRDPGILILGQGYRERSGGNGGFECGFREVNGCPLYPVRPLPRRKASKNTLEGPSMAPPSLSPTQGSPAP